LTKNETFERFHFVNEKDVKLSVQFSSIESISLQMKNWGKKLCLKITQVDVTIVTFFMKAAFFYPKSY